MVHKEPLSQSATSLMINSMANYPSTRQKIAGKRPREVVWNETSTPQYNTQRESTDQLGKKKRALQTRTQWIQKTSPTSHTDMIEERGSGGLLTAEGLYKREQAATAYRR